MRKTSSSFSTMKALVIAVIGLIGMACDAYAQNSRQYIRDAIKEWGSCRNVTITKRNGDLALYGRNGWAMQGCPSGLKSSIQRLRDDGEYIDDVQLTESGDYIILYGDNGIIWSDIPYQMERKLREYNNDQEVITSVTFNDDGDWIIITKNYFSTSDSDITDWLKSGIDDYGKLWTACLTDDALVAVYERGYKFLGNVPDDLKTALRNSSKDIVHVKIAGTAWFISDNDGYYRYNM